MSDRDALLERYRALPLPTTKDESWRFTDLKDFDPESFSANGASGVAGAAATPVAPFAENASGSKPFRSVNRHDSSFVVGIGSAR